MIRLLFVADGERDAVMIPRLVSNLVGARVEPTSHAWSRLHSRGKGYDRKLLYALTQARSAQLDGVVATADEDSSRRRERLHALESARRVDRERHPAISAAIGVARPHAEAWLLDDAEAVRQTLRLQPGIGIPTIRKTANPKAALTTLFLASPRQSESELPLLAEMADVLDPARCSHGQETGFASFAEDVRTEIAPLLHA